jgi:hypothetical protein
MEVVGQGRKGQDGTYYVILVFCQEATAGYFLRKERIKSTKTVEKGFVVINQSGKRRQQNRSGTNIDGAAIGDHANETGGGSCALEVLNSHLQRER